MPLASVHELVRLQRRVTAGLGRIRAPVLVAHGAHDRTADPRDAERILQGLGSARKEHKVYPDSGHVVPVDYDGERLSVAIADFLAGCL